MGKLTGSRPQYLVVNCADNATKSYVDSRWMPSHDTVRPVFSTWTESQLTFGQTSDGSSDWAGSFVANHRFSCRSECIRSEIGYIREVTPSQLIFLRSLLRLKDLAAQWSCPLLPWPRPTLAWPLRVGFLQPACSHYLVLILLNVDPMGPELVKYWRAFSTQMHQKTSIVAGVDSSHI